MCDQILICIEKIQKKLNPSLDAFMLFFLVILIVSIIVWQICFYRRENKRYKNMEKYIDKELGHNQKIIVALEAKLSNIPCNEHEVSTECNCIQTDGWDKYKNEFSDYLLTLKVKKYKISKKAGEVKAGKTQVDPWLKYIRWTRMYETLAVIQNQIHKYSNTQTKEFCQQFCKFYEEAYPTK